MKDLAVTTQLRSAVVTGGSRLAAVLASASILWAGVHGLNSSGIVRAHAAAKQLYNVTSLGRLQGQRVVATSMNSKGEIVGGTGVPCGAAACVAFGYGSEAFVWKSGKLIDLGPGVANDINAKGEIVGQIFDAKNNSVAAVWKKDKPWNDVTFARDLRGFGGPWSAAFAVNDKGVIVGDSEVNEGGSDLCRYVCHAFSYNPGAAHPMTDLGPAGSLSGQAYGINDSNTIVGQANGSKWVAYGQGPGLEEFGVQWQAGHMTRLRMPGIFGYANAINANGVIAGAVDLKPLAPSDNQCSNATGDSLYEGAIWRNGKLSTLGATSIYPDSQAFSINDKGVVGGVLANQCSFEAAAIWSKGKLTDLTRVTPPLPGGTRLVYVGAVGDNGDLVATAIDVNTQTEFQSYLLTPCHYSCTTRIQQSVVAHRVESSHEGSRPVSQR